MSAQELHRIELGLPTNGTPPRLGKYDIIARLGQGGMSQVYLAVARDAIDDVRKLVVLKVLHDSLAGNADYIEMFRREARIAMNLSHPNVVHTYSVGQEDGRHCIVMEYLNGVPLSALLRKAKDWPLRDRFPLLGTLCLVLSGLHYVHEFRDLDRNHLRLVHRDLKPGNILIGFDGQVKLLDFGVVKMSAPEHDQTQSLSLKGTVQYVAPEALDGSRPVDRRADIFAAGLVMWELLTGKRFWDGREPLQIMRALVDGEMASVLENGPSFPRPLRETLERALTKDPDGRHPTALELRADIQRYLNAAHFRIDADQLSGMVMRYFGDLRDERRQAVSAMLQRLRKPADGDAATSLSGVPQLGETDVPSRPSGANEPTTESHEGEPGQTHPGNQSAVLSPPPSSSLLGQPRSRGMLAALLAVPLLAGGAYLLTRDSSPSQGELDAAGADAAGKALAAAGIAAPAQPNARARGDQKPAKLIEVMVNVTPANASIEVDGVAQSGNPARLQGEDPDAKHEVVARANGYATETTTVSMKRSQTIELRLQATASGGPAPAPVARRGRKRKPKRPPANAGSKKPSPPAEAAPPADPPPSSPRPGDDLSTKNKRRPKSEVDTNIPWQ